MGAFIIPVIIVVLALAFVGGFLVWSKRYIKVPPDKVAIITGRKRKLGDKEVGYRIVRGGATFVWPIIEQTQYLSLELMTIDVRVTDAYNKDGVPVSIDAIANIKIKSDDTSVINAVERFLGRPQEIQNTALQTLEAHLRAIVGTMTIEELNSDRKTFAEKITSESLVDLQKMGLDADSIGIKSISDAHNYLNALGQKRTAEVQRDAAIGKAQAEAEAKKKTSEAMREAAEIAAENERKIAEANKNLSVKKAAYAAEVQAQEALAAQAGPKAKALAEKDVKTAEQATLAAETEGATLVQEKEAARRQKQLEATTIREAEANQKAAVINAEAQRQAAILKADGEAQAAIKLAEAKKSAAVLEAEGDAAKIRQQGQAAADAEKAKLVAIADGTKAQLLAEAEGKEKLAEALTKLNQAGQLLFLMEKSPEVIKAIGEAGGEVAEKIFSSLASSLGSIDNLTVWDTGSGGDGAMNRVASIVPKMFFDFVQQLKASGLVDPTEILKKASELLGNKLAAMSKEAVGDKTGQPAKTEDGSRPKADEPKKK
ncbi:flotillin family protein [Candidatus Falkowbacteria bacterium]|nr:flotillin family protein [Candidatus Falkowbacteria bacterium]